MRPSYNERDFETECAIIIDELASLKETYSRRDERVPADWVFDKAEKLANHPKNPIKRNELIDAVIAKLPDRIAFLNAVLDLLPAYEDNARELVMRIIVRGCRPSYEKPGEFHDAIEWLDLLLRGELDNEGAAVAMVKLLQRKDPAEIELAPVAVLMRYVAAAQWGETTKAEALVIDAAGSFIEDWKRDRATPELRQLLTRVNKNIAPLEVQEHE